MKTYMKGFCSQCKYLAMDKYHQLICLMHDKDPEVITHCSDKEIEEEEV